MLEEFPIGLTDGGTNRDILGLNTTVIGQSRIRYGEMSEKRKMTVAAAKRKPTIHETEIQAVGKVTAVRREK